MRADADMILVHDPVRELKFLEDGYGVNRKVIAYNFFVVAGPSDDPANVRGMSPTEAFRKIKEFGEKGEVIWISRGDDSGTHAKEKRLWNGGIFCLRKWQAVEQSTKASQDYEYWPIFSPIKSQEKDECNSKRKSTAI